MAGQYPAPDGASPPSAPLSTLVVIPAFGSPELTDAVLGDLARDGSDRRPDVRIVVVDNGGDYVVPVAGSRVEVHRPGGNLRWIGSANWALHTAVAEDIDVCVVLNNDIRLSKGFLDALTAPFAEDEKIAVAAACYDDFWLHQRARFIPENAYLYLPRTELRDVPFCDGTAVAFAAHAIVELGALDTVAFPRHGYGSDIDLALRVRAAGLRSVVTEAAYVSHLRRVTMNRTGQTSEDNRAEILDGMDGKWGPEWRAEVGLSPNAFPAHNTGSGSSWYLSSPRYE
jgi:GT2 family glycosyltransferase